MNDEIRSKLDWRAMIVENVDSLIKHGSGIDYNQLSLFEDNNKESIKMSVPENVNYDAMIAREKDVLGVCLTYNIFDKYILIQKRFCNNTIRTINEITESTNGILFLGTIIDIEYKKSLAGNNYARIFIQDSDSSISVYLWGDAYKRLISKIFKNRIYLIEADYNSEKSSLAISNIRSVDDIEIDKFMSGITIFIDNIFNVEDVQRYVSERMFGSQLKLSFNYMGDVFEAPYKVNFREEDYLYLKDKITKIEVQNDR